MRGAIAGVVVVVLVLVLAPGAAQASADVDEARRLLGEADFDGARAALERAERAEHLERAELVALYESWALLHLATQDDAAMRTDVARLASLDPEHLFGADVPPELVTAFAHATAARDGPLDVDVRAQRDGSDVAVVATATGDVGLVERVAVHARGAHGAWSLGVGSLRVAALDPVEYFAEALGPGGAVLAARGSVAEPLVLRVGAVAPADAARQTDATLFWAAVVGGSVALLVVIVVVVAVVAGSGGGQALDGPHLVS